MHLLKVNYHKITKLALIAAVVTVFLQGCSKQSQTLNVHVSSGDYVLIGKTKISINSLTNATKNSQRHSCSVIISADDNIKHSSIRRVIDSLSTEGFHLFSIKGKNQIIQIEFGTLEDCSYAKRNEFPKQSITIIVGNNKYTLEKKIISRNELCAEAIIQQLKNLDEEFVVQIICDLSSNHNQLVDLLEVSCNIKNLKGFFIISRSSSDVGSKKSSKAPVKTGQE